MDILKNTAMQQLQWHLIEGTLCAPSIESAIVFGFENPKEALIKYVSEDYQIKDKQGVLWISESGVYQLMMHSTKTTTVVDWLCSTVIPSIINDGIYVSEQENNTLNELNKKIPYVSNLLLDSKSKATPKNKQKNSVHFTVGNISMYDFSQNLKTLYPRITRNKLFQVLRYYEYLKRDNSPYGVYIRRGYFEVEEIEYNGKPYMQTFVTPKGQKYLAKKFINLPNRPF